MILPLGIWVYSLEEVLGSIPSQALFISFFSSSFTTNEQNCLLSLDARLDLKSHGTRHTLLQGGKKGTSIVVLVMVQSRIELETFCEHNVRQKS